MSNLTPETVRPWRDRVWFYRPGQWRPGWRVVQWSTADEYDWHTLVVGSRLTGAVVIARKPCPGTGRCAEIADYLRRYRPGTTGGDVR